MSEPNCESNARQAGWNTNRLPAHAKTVLVRLDDPKMPVWLSYYDGKRWRSLGRGEMHGVTGWMELSETAFFLDQIGNPSDS